jgi:hypothetical protein
MAAMEFSYRISEQDYTHAWKLRVRSLRKQRTLKTVMFWVFILACLFLLWAIINKTIGPKPPDSAPPAVTDSAPQAESNGKHGIQAESLITSLGPFLLIAGVWVFLVTRWMPSRLRKFYLNDPLMQGTFTVSLTAGSISFENTAGYSSRATWNIYERWREGKNVIILIYRSQTYLILNLAGLTEPQRAELRSILADALPQK